MPSGMSLDILEVTYHRIQTLKQQPGDANRVNKWYQA